MSEVFSEAQARALEKYSIDGEFKEPLVRCDACQTLLFVSDLHTHGMCPCGNTRVRNVRMLTEKEMEQAKEWVEQGHLDSDWLALWKETA